MPNEPNSPLHDAVIVGAGPAGCSCARELAAHGLDVVLVERERFPRWKPCAGGLSRKMAALLPAELRGQIERTALSARLTYGPDNVARYAAAEPIGWLVHRERFDHAHLNLVRALPAVEVREGRAVRLVERRDDHVRVTLVDGDIVRARVAVGADGVSSVVGRDILPDPSARYGVAIEAETEPSEMPVDPDLVFDFASFPGGYGWVFPKAHSYSVGGFVRRPREHDIRERLTRFISSVPSLSGVRVARCRGYRVPVGTPRRLLAGGRALLVGDAAGLVDPVTGEGISYAFLSGQLAARAITAFVRKGSDLSAYPESLAGVVREMRRAHRLAEILYAHPFRAFQVLMRDAFVRTWFVDVLRGKRTYAGFLLRVAAAIPRLLIAATQRHTHS